MAEDKRAKRLQRYMRLLRETASPATMLLEFPGERSVRCASGDLDALCRDGLAAVDGEDASRKAVLTREGRAALRRAASGDFAGQHRRARRVGLREDGREQQVIVNDAESPLAALARLRDAEGVAWLSRRNLASGERLRADFERAMLQPRVTASWDFSRTAAPQKGARNAVADLSDTAVAARDRVNAAIDAVGPELGGTLLDICCFLKGLEQVERERGWPRRSAKLMLKTALAALDRHYHPEPKRGRHARRILQWGAEGFRPTMSGK